MAKYDKFIDGDRFVLRRNQFGRIERFTVPKDEYDWAITWKKIGLLCQWYRCFGWIHEYKHPMNKSQDNWNIPKIYRKESNNDNT